MDPTGPWSYAYNRLAVAGAKTPAASSTSEFLQNNLLTTTTTAGSSHTTTAQLFLQAQGGLTSPYNTSGFISPPSHSTIYEPAVFPPTHFQQHSPKPTHVTVKSENEPTSYTSFYNQNASTASPEAAATLAWHQTNSNQISPFGILPHESAGGSEAGATETSHFTNSAFTIQHNTNQLSGIKNASSSRSGSPQAKQQQQQTTNNSNTNSYYRQPSFVDSAAQTVNKPTNPTCIVIASQAVASPNTTKDNTSTITVASTANTMYSGNLSRSNDRIRTTPNTTTNSVNHAINSGFGVPLMSNKVNQSVQIQQQTKAQNKTYPQFFVVEEADRKETAGSQNEQEPISYYTIIDGRFAYAATPGGTTNLQTPRHFLLTNSTDLDVTRVKVENQYSSNHNECSNTIIVPRRPSPAQSNSSQVPSPAYPIYNSPMNSIESPSQHSTGSSHPSDSTGNIVIYKTNQQQNQMTPQTPLDASISRNANTLTNNSPVAYSSVITHALDPSKLAEQTYQASWSITNDAKQKLIGMNSKQPFYNNNAQIGALSNVHKGGNHVAENILVTTDRPLASQIQIKMNNQHLATTTAAANITIPNVLVQSQQQQSAPQQPPATKGRRRKNASKTREQLLSENEFLVNREPPPAHCAKATESAINPQPQPQQEQQHSLHQLQNQQNGATPYFDLARWNIPAKINPAMPILPNQMNYGSHHQQQHHHQPPIITPQAHCAPMSYYPSFQIHADLQNKNLNMSGGAHGEKPEVINPIKDITPIETQTVAEEQPPPEEEPKPKVIVPNIEEELDFLSTDKPPKKPSNQLKKQLPAAPLPKQPEPAKPLASTRNGIGFMESYLKFLSGERDTSPPPTPRTGRRNWQKPIITSVQVVPNPTTQTNKTDESEPSTSTTTMTSPTTPAQQSSIEPNETLSETKKTKSRKKKLSDNEPETSPHDPQQQQYQQQQPQQSIYRSPLPKKARPQMAMQMPSMYNDASSIFNNSQSTTGLLDQQQQPHNATLNASSSTAVSNHLMQPQFHPNSSLVVTTSTPYQYHQIQEDPLVVPERRETSTRKAKARGLAEIIGKTSDNEEEPPEFVDSDTDPVWTPQDEYDDEPKSSSKRKQRNPKSVTRLKHSNILTAAVLNAGIDESGSESTDDDSDDGSRTKNKQRPVKKTLSSKLSIGDFVILSSEQHQESPSLWEIDRKSILQKYEPFVESDKLFYKSKTLFTTWRNNSMDLYMRVAVRKCFQNSSEKIVELIRPQQSSQSDDSEFVEKLMIIYLDYRDRFKVYVQTLISQALDSSFFIEIMREQDTYFLPNITAIDTIIDACREKLSTAIKWPERISAAIKMWPNYRIIREMEMNKYRCATCNEVAGITFSLSGPAYNGKTLLAVVPDSVVALYDKNITMCHSCVKKAEALHKITHEKYNLFAVCSKRVQDLSIDNEKGSTEILKELLADSNWINELFKIVRIHWIEAHKIERQFQFVKT